MSVESPVELTWLGLAPWTTGVSAKVGEAVTLL